MKNVILVLLFCLALTPSGEAKASEVDLSISGGQIYTTAVAYRKLYNIEFLEGLRFGWVTRLTHANKSGAAYETAPADIRRRKSDWLSGITASEIPNNIDTLKVENTQATFAAIGYALEYQASQRWILGHSLDVFGFTFGPESDALYTPNPNRGSSTSPAVVKAKPSNTNLFLFGDNDIGSLNSEFYVTYSLNDNYSLRGGLAYTFVEYKTDRKLDFDNDRFRIQATGLLIALNYRF